MRHSRRTAGVGGKVVSDAVYDLLRKANRGQCGDEALLRLRSKIVNGFLDQHALGFDETDDFIEPLAGFLVAEDEGTFAAHLAGIAIHHFE